MILFILSLVENIGSYSKGTVARVGAKDIEAFKGFYTGSSAYKTSLFFGLVATLAWEMWDSSIVGWGVVCFELWLEREFLVRAYLGISGIK